ncbi:MAG: hypothetical protein RLZZ78_911 [Armatimonadota bacterium]
MSMKLSVLLLAPVLLAIAGCKPNGHDVRQTMFHKDIFLHIPSSDFNESNHRTIHVLPHTWVTIKRVSVVLSDGTVVPVRDFKPGALELIHDENSARLLGTIELPVPDPTQVVVVIDQGAQCTASEGESLQPCTLTPAKTTNANRPTSAGDGELTLNYVIPSRDRDSPRLVLQLTTDRGIEINEAPIEVSLLSSSSIPLSVDAVQTPFINLISEPGLASPPLPYALKTRTALSSAATVTGTINAETRLFTPVVVFDQGMPERITISGTVTRLDIAKRTFQLRVDDASNGQAYATLRFRVGEQTTYGFAESLPPAPATFTDITLGRRIWVRVSGKPDPDDRLDALDVRITSQDHHTN